MCNIQSINIADKNSFENSQKPLLTVLGLWKENFVRNGDTIFLSRVNNIISNRDTLWNGENFEGIKNQYFGFELNFDYGNGQEISSEIFFDISYVQSNYKVKNKSTKSIFLKYIPVTYSNQIVDPQNKVNDEPVVLLNLNSIKEYKILDGNHKLEYYKQQNNYLLLPTIELKKADIQVDKNIFYSDFDYEFFNLWVDIKNKYN